MAEEKQEDLSMEDILSSIKDILDKDAEGRAAEAVPAALPQTPAPVSEPAAAPQVKAVEPETEEDVFDLSEAMIVNDSSPLFDSPSENDDIDLKLDDVDTDLEELSLDNLSETLPSADENQLLTVAETAAAAPQAAETIAAPVIARPAAEEAKAETAMVENETDVLAPVSDSPVFEIEELDSLPVETEIVETTDDKDDVSANIDEILNSASKVIYADSKTETPVDVAKTVEEKTPEEKEQPKIEEAVQTSVEDDATDVSANIISNFAKMFAEKKEDIAAAEAAAPAVADFSAVKFLGEGSKTIEQVVENVIREIISSTVSAELAANVDIITFAKEEIEAQTKEWLDANLPAVVENAVQKEIERVMAKVGK